MEISKIVRLFGRLFVSVCLFTTIVFTADKRNSMRLRPQNHFQMGVTNKRQVRFTKTINHDTRSPESDKYQNFDLKNSYAKCATYTLPKVINFNRKLGNEIE